MSSSALTATSRSPFNCKTGMAFLYACALILMACVAAPRTALCAAPGHLLLDQPVLYEQNEMLRTDFSVTVDDEEGLHDMLKDGAVLELHVDITLERNRSWWGNAEVTTVSYQSIIRHDPLSRDFVVTIPGKREQEQQRDRNLTRLLHSSWRKLSLPVAPVRLLEAEGLENEYTVAIIINLRHTEVPPWLEKNLVFWSAEVVPQVKTALGYQPGIR